MDTSTTASPRRLRVHHYAVHLARSPGPWGHRPGLVPDGGALSLVRLDGGVSIFKTSGAVGAAHLTPDGRAIAVTRVAAAAGTDSDRPPSVPW